jgi:putative methyltransferase (TIGR04325 family)
MDTQLAKRIATHIPPVQALRERRYERCFRDGYGLFRGVFTGFAAASLSAPRGKRVGHNWPEYAPHHIARADHIEAYDYPCLFWLGRILRTGSRVFDYGGNVGVHYHGYGKYLDYPADFAWNVCELPELVRLGEQIARERGCRSLRFTTEFADAEGADVLIAAGVLQYIEEPLADRLAMLRRRPRHLLLNKLPLYDGEPFITLQDGPVYVPHHVFNRTDFVAALGNLGYELIDSWDVPGFSCYVPFNPGRDVPMYSGLYFRQTS